MRGAQAGLGPLQNDRDGTEYDVVNSRTLSPPGKSLYIGSTYLASTVTLHPGAHLLYDCVKSSTGLGLKVSIHATTKNFRLCSSPNISMQVSNPCPAFVRLINTYLHKRE
jgi:hypothetical protein